MRLIMIVRIYALILLSSMGLWAFFSEKYEPPDGRVLHGLGQYVNLTFYTEEENWQLVTEYQDATEKVPVIYSAYAYTDPYVDSLDSTNLIDIATNHGYPYVLLVGLSLFDSSSTTSSVNIPVHSFLNGDLDDQIIKIAQEIKNIISTPVFVRPGYEFGKGNDGLHNDDDNPDWTAENFKLIWLRIYNIFDQQGVTNVAWVWNTVNPQSFDFMDWYPGDEYVDWWGIDYFTTSQINNADAFLDSANIHQKPVMICESNPIENGGTTNADNWDDWFVPYFDKIKNISHIKAFVYISDPWDKPGFFDSWPDSRITSNNTILTNYSAELENPVYIHMDEYQNNPGIIDSPLPVSLTSFIISSLSNENLIQWRTESEINNLGFNIYRACSNVDVPVDELKFFKINASLIPGAGTSSLPHEYHFKDFQVKDKFFYWYQLEGVDYTGKATKHEIKKIYRNKKIPDKIHIYQNYPNPFNSETIIGFDISRKSKICLSIYNIDVSYVETVVYRTMPEGYHEVSLDASNLASGVYLFCIQAENLTQTKKMILMK